MEPLRQSNKTIEFFKQQKYNTKDYEITDKNLRLQSSRLDTQHSSSPGLNSNKNLGFLIQEMDLLNQEMDLKIKISQFSSENENVFENFSKKDYFIKIFEIQHKNQEYIRLYEEECQRHALAKVIFNQKNWKNTIFTLKKEIAENSNPVNDLKLENRMLKERFIEYQAEQDLLINKLKLEIQKLTKIIENTQNNKRY